MSLLKTTKLQSFKQFADLIDAKIKGKGRAALSCSRDTSCRSVLLFWASDAGYGSVWCWVRAALGTDFQTVFGKVRLECVVAAKSGPDFASSVAPEITVGTAGSVERPIQAAPPSAARGSRDMEVVSSHRGSRAIQATAAASVSKTPSAASAPSLTAGKGTAAPAVGEASAAAASSLRGSLAGEALAAVSACLGPPQGEKAAPKKARPTLVSDDPAAWLVVKALGLLREVPTCSKALAMNELQVGERIGEGSFGVVRQGIVVATGQQIVQKKLKKENTGMDFINEVAILARLRHPNVVRLLDVVLNPSIILIFAYAGLDLAQQFRAKLFPAARWREVALQISAGLAYVHDCYVVHADLKPANVCWEPEEGVATIIDFGNSIVGLPGYRTCRPDLPADGLQYQTLGFRAIEIALGDVAWGSPSDCWAMGVLFAGLCGFHGLFRASTVEEMVLKIFRRLGSPHGDQVSYFAKLPLYSVQMPVRFAPSLETFLPDAPEDFLEVFRGLLQLCPADRWLAERARQFLAGSEIAAAARVAAEKVAAAPAAVKAAAAPALLPAEVDAAAAVVENYLASVEMEDELARDLVVGDSVAAGQGDPYLTLLGVGGVTTLHGDRGAFNILEGWLGAGLLAWLQTGLTGMNEWSFDRVDPRKKDRWIEMKQKLEICGHLEPISDKKRGLTLNGKDASRPLDRRLRAFAAAFKACNDGSLQAVDAAIKEAVLAVPKAERGLNGKTLLRESASDWAFSLGALQVMVSNDRRDPVHFDGGASFLHAGVTLFGERALRLRHSKENGIWKEMEVRSAPGHFYMGCLCGPEHYVQHKTSEPTRLLPTESCGNVEVVLLLRSRIFRDGRSSTQQSGPTPLLLWDALAPAVAAALARTRWVLPPLTVCQGLEETLP